MVACKDAVIVGGGFAGLSAAFHLRKLGIDAHVYEKSTDSNVRQGMTITIAPNGSRTLPEEVLGQMRTAGLCKCPCLLVDKQGNTVLEWFSAQAEEIYKHPQIILPWEAMLKILSDALPDECKHYGHEFCDVTDLDGEDGATVHFSHGGDKITVKASLVIGADGLRSQVRSCIFGPLPIQDHGRTVWRAGIDSSLCSRAMPLQEGVMLTANAEKSLYIANGIHGKMFWTVITKDDEGMKPTELKQALLAKFEDWPLAQHVIEATDLELILERRLSDMNLLTSWSRGCVVLIGDAAHATLPNVGQGANLSLEDGKELAVQLSECSNLRTALEMFEQRRAPRAATVQKFGRMLLNAPPGGEPKIPWHFYDWLHKYE